MPSGCADIKKKFGSNWVDGNAFCIKKKRKKKKEDFPTGIRPPRNLVCTRIAITQRR